MTRNWVVVAVALCLSTACTAERTSLGLEVTNWQGIPTAPVANGLVLVEFDPSSDETVPPKCPHLTISTVRYPPVLSHIGGSGPRFFIRHDGGLVDIRTLGETTGGYIRDTNIWFVQWHPPAGARLPALDLYAYTPMQEGLRNSLVLLIEARPPETHEAQENAPVPYACELGFTWGELALGGAASATCVQYAEEIDALVAVNSEVPSGLVPDSLRHQPGLAWVLGGTRSSSARWIAGQWSPEPGGAEGPDKEGAEGEADVGPAPGEETLTWRLEVSPGAPQTLAIINTFGAEGVARNLFRRLRETEPNALLQAQVDWWRDWLSSGAKLKTGRQDLDDLTNLVLCLTKAMQWHRRAGFVGSPREYTQFARSSDAAFALMGLMSFHHLPEASRFLHVHLPRFLTRLRHRLSPGSLEPHFSMTGWNMEYGRPVSALAFEIPLFPSLAWDHYVRTHDLDLLADAWPWVQKFIAELDKHSVKTGPYKGLIDLKSSVYGKETLLIPHRKNGAHASQLLAQRAMQTAANMARLIVDRGTAAHYQSRADRMARALEPWWDQSRQCYAFYDRRSLLWPSRRFTIYEWMNEPWIERSSPRSRDMLRFWLDASVPAGYVMPSHELDSTALSMQRYPLYRDPGNEELTGKWRDIQLFVPLVGCIRQGVFDRSRSFLSVIEEQAGRRSSGLFDEWHDYHDLSPGTSRLMTRALGAYLWGLGQLFHAAPEEDGYRVTVRPAVDFEVALPEGPSLVVRRTGDDTAPIRHVRVNGRNWQGHTPWEIVLTGLQPRRYEISVEFDATSRFPSRRALVSHAKREARAIMAHQLEDGALVTELRPSGLVTIDPRAGTLAAIGLVTAYDMTGKDDFLAAADRWATWYAGHLDEDGTVGRYEGRGDQYAKTSQDPVPVGSPALFLRFLWEYYRVSLDIGFLQARADAAKKSIDAIRLGQDEADGLVWAKDDPSVAHFLENLDVWRGLWAASQIAKVNGDHAEEEAHAALAAKTAESLLAKFWIPARGHFVPTLTQDRPTGQALRTWYPDAVANLRGIQELLDPKDPACAKLFRNLYERFYFRHERYLAKLPCWIGAAQRLNLREEVTLFWRHYTQIREHGPSSTQFHVDPYSSAYGQLISAARLVLTDYDRWRRKRLPW